MRPGFWWFRRPYLECAASAAIHATALAGVHTWVSSGWFSLELPGERGVQAVASRRVIQLTAGRIEAADTNRNAPVSVANQPTAAPDFDVYTSVTPGRHTTAESVARPLTPALAARQAEIAVELPGSLRTDPDLAGAERSLPEGTGPAVPMARRGTTAALALDWKVTLEALAVEGGWQATVPLPRSNPPPRYPPELLAVGQSGTVLVALSIDATGRVEQCEVRQSSGFPAFDAAALEAARTWVFVPGQRFGIPVATRVLCPVRFQFQGPE